MRKLNGVIYFTNSRQKTKKRRECILSKSINTKISKIHLVNIFKGRVAVRTKIVMDNKITEKLNLFTYLGNNISYEEELDIDNK